MNLDDAYLEFQTNMQAPPPMPVPTVDHNDASAVEAAKTPVPIDEIDPEPQPKPPSDNEQDTSLGNYLSTVFTTLGDIPDATVRGALKGLGETIYGAGLVDDEQIKKFRSMMDATSQLAVKQGVNPIATGLVEDVSQILPSAIPAFKIFKGLGMARPVAAILAEGIGGAFGYNPDDPNLGNMIQGLIGKDSKGALAQSIKFVADGLATNPEDPNWQNRARNFAQDAGIGFAFEGIFKAIKASPNMARSAAATAKTLIDYFNDTAKAAQQGTAFSGIPTRVNRELDNPAGDVWNEPLPAEPAPVFYSAVANAVDGLPMDKGSGAQMRAMIAKESGVKEEEMAWIGLDDFLKDKKSVTKQEIKEFVDANQVRIEEVVKGKDKEGYTPFEEYTLPGGENNRVVLLRLPSKTGAETNTARYEELNNIAARRNLTDSESDEMLAIEQAEFSGISGTAGEDFVGGHYDEKNVLAHMRLNDRTGPNGEKILFVEEIQSDWHQKGRKQGYKTPERFTEPFQVIPQIEGMDNYILYEVRDANGEFITNVGSEVAENADQAVIVARGRIRDETAVRDDRVPDAPLKKTWHEMSFRRIARMAAEKGYDAIAWTPGRVQAERYDLSKRVKNIEVWNHPQSKDYPDGVRSVQINGNDNNLILSSSYTLSGVIRSGEFEGKHLSDVIGKEMADKIMSIPVRASPPSAMNLAKRFDADDLEVGGEGMKGFYDKMLKGYASKWGKKFGAKVGVTQIGTKHSLRPVTDGQGNWKIYDPITGDHWMDPDTTRIPTFTSREEAASAIKGAAKGADVWTLPVTKKMRDSVLSKGVATFGVAGVAAGLNQQEARPNGN